MDSFLKSVDLEAYYEGFKDNGFDDLQLVLTLSSEQLSDCFDAVAIHLLGHRMKIENSLKAMKMKASEKTDSVDFSRNSSEGSTSESTIYPKSISDLLAENELSPQVKFFNGVFTGIYETAFSALPNIDQFRDYVRGQQIHRWEIKCKCNEFIEKLKVINSGETSDTRLKKIYTYTSGNHICKPVDCLPLRNAIDVLNNQLAQCNKFTVDIKQMRKSLYKKDLSLRKHWKIKQVEFYQEILNEYEKFVESIERIIQTLETKHQEVAKKYSTLTLEEVAARWFRSGN